MGLRDLGIWGFLELGIKGFGDLGIYGFKSQNLQNLQIIKISKSQSYTKKTVTKKQNEKLQENPCASTG